MNITIFFEIRNYLPTYLPTSWVINKKCIGHKSLETIRHLSSTINDCNKYFAIGGNKLSRHMVMRPTSAIDKTLTENNVISTGANNDG